MKREEGRLEAAERATHKWYSCGLSWAMPKKIKKSCNQKEKQKLS